MRILHYFLGFHRSGGLNRYAADLAQEQARLGDEVFVLFPGGGILPRRHAVIRRRSPQGKVRCFELLGGRAVPLLSGIRDPQMILGEGHRLPDEEISRFCGAAEPDIFHIHTWMGFPEELLAELKHRKVKVVFTTHDYFGLCPRVNFIDASGKLCKEMDDRKCSICNAGAPSERALALRNNRILLAMKELLRPLAGVLQRRASRVADGTPETHDYTALREHYIALLRQCDLIHANSEVSAGVYDLFVPGLPLQLLPISHSGITDHRRSKDVGETVKLAFSGSSGDFKGLPRLLRVLDGLYESGIRNWHLDVWGPSECGNHPHVTFRGGYNLAQHAEVYGGSDLLIVPSVCNETFGFVVPEALSFGTPVLCSDTVGAQTLVSPEMVFHGENGLREKLEILLREPDKLKKLNQTICKGLFEMDMESHAKKMSILYDRICRGKP